MNIAISSTVLPTTQDTMDKIILSRPVVSTGPKDANSNNKNNNKKSVVVIKAKTQRGRAKKWTKPDGKPKRPLSAYNFFFRDQRSLILGVDKPSQEMEDLKKRSHCKTHGKISFSDMAKLIGIRWKSLDECSRKAYGARAQIDMQRYTTEVGIWKKQSSQQEQATYSFSQEKGPVLAASVICKDFGMHPSQCPSSDAVEYLGYLQGNQLEQPSFRHFSLGSGVPEALLWRQPVSSHLNYPLAVETVSAASILLEQYHQQQQHDLARLTIACADLDRLRLISEMNSKLALFFDARL